MAWLAKVLRGLRAGSAVLDLGCGSGNPVDIEIAKSHQITGVDISEVQIEQARANVPSGHFIHGDIVSMTFEARSFDAVVSFYAIEHIPRRTLRSLSAHGSVAAPQCATAYWYGSRRLR